MNSKITLARLAQIVATKSGVDLKDCEEVLRQMFKNISACLEGGESIRIKGFGTFKISAVEARKSVDVTSGEDNEIPAHNRIVFVPSKELAAAVNAPFDMFETIVVEEGILEEELIQAESEPDNLMATSLREQLILEEEKEDNLKKEYPEVFSETQQSEATEDVLSTEPSEKTQKDEQPTKDTPSSDNSIASGDAISTEDSVTASPEAGQSAPAVTPKRNYEEKNDDDDEEEDEDIKRPKRRVWPWYIVAGIGVIIVGCGLLWWLNDDFSNWGKSLASGIWSRPTIAKDSVADLEVATLIDNEDNVAEEGSDQTGLVEEEMLSDKDADANNNGEDKSADETVPTQASDKKAPVQTIDSVSQTRYLTTIAKQHYGNFHLWPYIYKENEKILGHPNRIKPGTKVVVPDLSKYGVDPKNPEDLEKAKKLGVEIYKKYK